MTDPTSQPVVWATCDGDDVLFALPSTRRKVANLRRDPRATVVVYDAANPYESAQVQGTATLADDPDGALIDRLSHEYTGGPSPGFAGPNPSWVTVRVTADRVTTTSPG